MTGYIVIGIFLTITGLLLWVVPGEYNIPESGYANVDGLFMIAPWLFLFLCPAISMRAFAEEKQSGTWELLVTKPVSSWQIVLGKYLSGVVVVLAALVPTVLNYFVVSYLAEPVGNVDSGAFWGSFIGLGFLAAIYMAIGIFASSLTNNQVISFVLAIVICFVLFYGFDVLAMFSTSGEVISYIESVGINAHYKSVSRGVVDSRDLVYYLVVSFLFLLFTERKIAQK